MHQLAQEYFFMKWGLMMEINDNELMSLLAEDEEQVKNIIYDKYNYLIDVIINKYRKVISMNHIDNDEIYCEASYGFSDGINSFLDNKNTSLKTFLTLCIDRRVRKCIDKHTTNKHKIDKETLSLDYIYDESGNSMHNLLSDKEDDPLVNLTNNETKKELINNAKKELSNLEYEVFTMMINEISYIDIAKKMNKTPKQIDNTIQRIKNKLRKQMNNK